MTIHTVERGETLSELCRDVLRESGQDAAGKAIYQAVAKVARANGIENPDLIFAGQKIDLSELTKAHAEPSPVSNGPLGLSPGAAPDPHVPAGPRAEFAPSETRPAPLAQLPVFHDALLLRSLGAPASLPAAQGASAIPKTTKPVAPAHAGAADLLQTILEPRPVAAENSVAVPALAPAVAPPTVRSPWSKLLDTPARLTSEFGIRKDPIDGQWRYHSGIDLATDKGANIFPIKPGLVTFSGWKEGYGKVVIVRHTEGLETVYGHNAKNLVRVGAKVTTATPLAQVGSTGRSTGAHLHFEVRKGGVPVDPVPLVQRELIQVAKTL